QKHTLEKLLKQHRIRRFSADELPKLLRAPTLPLAPGSAEAIAERVQLLLPRLTLLHQQLRQVDRTIRLLLADLASDVTYPGHRDVPILLSFPGAGQGFTATVLSEAPRTLADRDYAAFARLGRNRSRHQTKRKTQFTVMRQACSHRIRQ